MKEIDDYLNETKGCYEMQWIDSHALAPHAPRVGDWRVVRRWQTEGGDPGGGVISSK